MYIKTLTVYIEKVSRIKYIVSRNMIVTSSYRSGNTAAQIDFVLFRKSLRKLVIDVKVIPGEEVTLQHQLLVCDMKN